MNWRHACIIVVLAFTAYFPTLRLGFIWDDHVIIEANTTLQDWSWKNLLQDFTSDNASGVGDNYYRPMQAITNRIDYSLWGLNPFGFHLTNLLFHIGNGLLLYLLVLRLGHSPLAAVMTSAFFAVHPIDVEEFIVVAGRCTQMGYFFMLAALLWSLEQGPWKVLLMMVSYALALLSKEQSLMVVPYVGLLFLMRKEKPRRYLLLVPLVVLSILYLFMRHAVVHHTLGASELSNLGLFMFKVFPRLCLHYATLLLWPWNLHNHRLIPHLSHFWWMYGTAFITLAVWLIRTRQRTGLFCFAWFLLWFLPTIPVMMNGGFMLDHWGYGVVICVFLPLSLGLVRLWKSRKDWLQRMAQGLPFAYLIVLALLVHLNVALRGTDEKIYRWALHFTTSNPIRYNLGVLLLQTGRPEEGVIFLEEVRDVYPDDANLTRALKQSYEVIRTRRKASRRMEAERAGKSAP